jgi:hypothetical protein
MNDDVFGHAIHAYANGLPTPDIGVSINNEVQDPLPVSYFFRSFESMPVLEQIALNQCGESVLDVGAAAGCHSVWLQGKRKKVTAVEWSPLSCEVMKSRGLVKVEQTDFFDYHPTTKFDTILLLMNGFGMGQTVEGTLRLLEKCAAMLNPGGTIIGETSDIAYFFDHEPKNQQERETPLRLPYDHYYGKVHFRLKWKSLKSEFSWVYPDPHLLSQLSDHCGLRVKTITEGTHHDYLVELTQR